MTKSDPLFTKTEKVEGLHHQNKIATNTLSQLLLLSPSSANFFHFDFFFFLSNFFFYFKHEMSEGKNEPIFLDIGGDGEGPTEIESLCMNCEENVSTSILFLPHPAGILTGCHFFLFLAF